MKGNIKSSVVQTETPSKIHDDFTTRNHHANTSNAPTAAPLSLQLSVSSSSVSPSPTTRRLSILTVGDGDFSGSLAILRAYGSHIQSLVATSLVASREELMELYYKYPHDSSSSSSCSTPSILNELEEHDCVTIFYGVDGTQLHREDSKILAHYRQQQQQKKQPEGGVDYIMFHHPHLGYDQDEDTIDNTSSTNKDGNIATEKHKHSAHAAKHSSLLANYLISARQLLLLLSRDDRANVSNSDFVSWCSQQKNQPRKKEEQQLPDEEPMIHVCLCAGQAKRWKLYPAIRRIGLELVGGRPRFASQPLWPHLPAAVPYVPPMGLLPEEEDENVDAAAPAAAPAAAGPTTPTTTTTSVSRRSSTIQANYWLSRYGYRHRATHPYTTTGGTTRQLSTVVNSHHYFFRVVQKSK